MARLVGCMFLTMLHDLEKSDVLSPTSAAANLGVVMGLYMQLFEKLSTDFGLLEEDPEGDGPLGGSLMLSGSIRLYAKKHGVEIGGADVLEDVINELDELDDLEIPEGDDPWSWDMEYRAYRDVSSEEMGGDHWDITTWKPKERKDAAFDGKDPLNRAMINHIKSGALMQMA